MRRQRPRQAALECVDHFVRVKGTSVRGATEKDVLQDPVSKHIYIAKLGGRNNDVEVMTEYAIYLIGRSLGVTVADARIAYYQGRLRFLSRYFLNIDGPEELVHGMQLFTELYDESTVTHVLHDESLEQKMFSVQAVKSAFGATYLQYGAQLEEELFDGFVSMLAHDALIGVMDRHHENWGIIVQREKGGTLPKFAPLYDSARGLFCNESDPELERRYCGRAGMERLDGFVARSRPLVGFDGLHPTKGRHYLTHEQLLAAVFHDYPNQRRRILSVLEAYDWKRVGHQLENELFGLCSPNRRQLMLTCLRRRLRSIRRAIEERMRE